MNHYNAWMIVLLDLLIIGSYKFGHKFKKDPDLIGLILFIICGPVGIFWTIEHLILKKIKNENKN